MSNLTDAVLGGLTRFAWVSDHLHTLADISPRHVGRVVTFEYAPTPDPERYDFDRVMGTLEGVHGGTVLVSGADYDWARISNMKVWRSEVKK